MPADRPLRTLEDLERAVRTLAREFKTDRVFVVGSQAILISWPDAPMVMRVSPEIDAFPENARIWEITERDREPSLPAEASEHIDALFGNGSRFHRTHGFYIDGVDENTAKLPRNWQTRALIRPIEVDGRIAHAVAPCPEDLIVSKLARLDPKDKAFVEAYHAERPLDLTLIEARIRDSQLEQRVAERAIAYLHALARQMR